MPLEYPTENPYAALGRAIANDAAKIRASNEHRADVIPRLRSAFHAINDATFGGALPAPTITLADLPPQRSGECHWRGWSWVEPLAIRLSTRHVDDFDKLLATLAHEIAHHAGFANRDWFEKDDAHGPVWRSILDAIIAGKPYVHRSAPPAKAGPAAAPTRARPAAGRGSPILTRVTGADGRTYAPDIHREPTPRSGFMRARRTYFYSEGGRTVRARPGELVPASSWIFEGGYSPDVWEVAQ